MKFCNAFQGRVSCNLPAIIGQFVWIVCKKEKDRAYMTGGKTALGGICFEANKHYWYLLPSVLAVILHILASKIRDLKLVTRMASTKLRSVEGAAQLKWPNSQSPT